MRQTAKRLLFIFGVLSLSSLWSPAALAGYTDPLDELFQSSAYQQPIPEKASYHHMAGSELLAEIANHSLSHVPALKVFRDTVPSRYSSLSAQDMPETLFNELFTAIEKANWLFGSSSNQMMMFICYSSYLNLSFKLKDGRSFVLYSRGYSPTIYPELNVDGPWLLKIGDYEFETLDTNISKAVLKIYQQLRPDLKSPNR